jgi:hypothetical protein
VRRLLHGDRPAVPRDCGPEAFVCHPNPRTVNFMREIETLTFVDVEERQEALMVVRSGPESVAVALSLRNGSDVECFMPVDVAERLQQALSLAVRPRERRPDPAV